MQSPVYRQTDRGLNKQAARQTGSQIERNSLVSPLAHRNMSGIDCVSINKPQADYLLIGLNFKPPAADWDPLLRAFKWNSLLLIIPALFPSDERHLQLSLSHLTASSWRGKRPLSLSPPPPLSLWFQREWESFCPAAETSQRLLICPLLISSDLLTVDWLLVLPINSQQVLLCQHTNSIRHNQCNTLVSTSVTFLLHLSSLSFSVVAIGLSQTAWPPISC